MLNILERAINGDRAENSRAWRLQKVWHALSLTVCDNTILLGKPSRYHDAGIEDATSGHLLSFPWGYS